MGIGKHGGEDFRPANVDGALLPAILDLERDVQI